MWTPPPELTRALTEGRISRREFVSRALALGISLEAIGLALVSCRPSDSRQGVNDPRRSRELDVFTWADGIPREVLRAFRDESGIDVQTLSFDSNEAMIARLQLDPAGADLAILGHHHIPALLALDLIAPLDHTVLTGLEHLDPRATKLYSDPTNTYSVPFTWGTIGIAYRSDRVQRPVDSWAAFFDRSLAGRTIMLAPDACLMAMLRYRGHSLNSTNQTELGRAKNDCVAAKEVLRAFALVGVREQLIAGDVWVAQIHDGGAEAARREAPAVQYVIPREGSLFWVDSAVVSRGARHPDAAHRFLSYLLRPAVAAQVAAAGPWNTPNLTARGMLAQPVPYPTDEEWGRLELERARGEDSIEWDRLIVELRAA